MEGDGGEAEDSDEGVDGDDGASQAASSPCPVRELDMLTPGRSVTRRPRVYTCRGRGVGHYSGDRSPSVTGSLQKRSELGRQLSFVLHEHACVRVRVTPHAWHCVAWQCDIVHSAASRWSLNAVLNSDLAAPL